MATPAPAKKNIFEEFRDFLNQGDFVTIAVGLVIALYFQQIVDSILVGVIFPIIAAIFGKPDFQDIGFDIGDARISIGLVINAIVSFIVVAASAVPDPEGVQPHAGHQDRRRSDTELSVLREIRDSMRAGGPRPSADDGPPTTRRIAGASTIRTGSGGMRPTAIDWIEPFDRVIDRSRRAGGAVVHRRRAQHVRQRRRPPRRRRARPTRLAIVYDSPVTATVRHADVRRAARRGRPPAPAPWPSLGVTKGDAVIIYMPMVPEAVIAMLACARLGAVHSVVFGGFAPNELAVRIDDARPKVIVSASCGIEVQRVIEYKPLLDLAIEAADPQARRLRRRCSGPAPPPAARRCPAASLVDGRDHDWDELVVGAVAHPCVRRRRHRPALHPLHVGHDREAEGRRARQRRARRGAALEPAQHLRHPSRRGVLGGVATSVGWWATATSSTPRCSPGARRSSTRASRSARPTPARSGGWWPSTA